MFARVFAVLPFALLVVADTTVTQCNTGPVDCCNQVQTLDQAQKILADKNLLDVAAQIGGLVGLDCSPITVIGAANACQVSQQSVCCSNNNFNGAVNIGCTPVAVGAQA